MRRKAQRKFVKNKRGISTPISIKLIVAISDALISPGWAMKLV
jgi:hypothetical protein